MTNSHEEYGQLISTHLPNYNMVRRKLIIHLIIAVPFVLISLFFVVIGLPEGMPFVAIVYGGFLFFTFLEDLPPILFILRQIPHVEVYEKGFLLHERSDSRFIHWDEIDDVRSIGNSLNDTTRLFKLFHQDKVVLQITEIYRDYALLAENMFEALLKHRDYQKILDDGGTIQCGPLTLSGEFVTAKSVEIRWSQIHAIQWHHSFKNVTIRYDGSKSVKLNMKKLHNVPIICTFMLNKITSELKTSAIIIQRGQPIKFDESSPTESEIQLPMEASLKHRVIYVELAIALVGLAISLYTIIPGIQHAIEWDLINGRWFLRAAPALIIPLVSIWLIFMDGKRLYQNPRFLITQTGVEVSTRHSKEMWKWTDVQAIRIIFVFAWFVIPRPTIQIVRAPGKVFNLNVRQNNYPVAVGAFARPFVDVQVPIYKRRIEQGETLKFGVLTINQSGINFRTADHGWDEIDSVEIQGINLESHLVFKDAEQNSIFAVPALQINNFDILLGLVQEKLNPPQAEEPIA